MGRAVSNGKPKGAVLDPKPFKKIGSVAEVIASIDWIAKRTYLKGSVG